MRPTAQIVMFDEAANIRVLRREVAPPQGDQVGVRILASLISSGSELRVLQRSFDAPHWVNWGRLPFFPGYAAVGVVEELGPEATLPAGRRVLVRCSHASWAVVPETACLLADEKLPLEAQVWFALAKIAATPLPAFPLLLGSSVAVVGDGPLAQMAVRWLRCAGAERILVIGRHPRRLACAVDGGATETRLLDEVSPDRHNVAPADLAIDISGTAPGFYLAQALVARRGTVLMLGDSGYPGELRFHPRVVPDGLHLIGAHDNLESASWSAPRIIGTFQRLVARGLFRVDGLITHRFAGEQAALAYERCSDKASSMGVLLDWRGLPDPRSV